MTVVGTAFLFYPSYLIYIIGAAKGGMVMLPYFHDCNAYSRITSKGEFRDIGVMIFTVLQIVAGVNEVTCAYSYFSIMVT